MSDSPRRHYHRSSDDNDRRHERREKSRRTRYYSDDESDSYDSRPRKETRRSEKKRSEPKREEHKNEKKLQFSKSYILKLPSNVTDGLLKKAGCEKTGKDMVLEIRLTKK